MHRRKSAFKTLLAGLAAAVLAMAIAFAQSAASLVTDKQDYSPGEVAYLAGTGFEAGESVYLTISIDDPVLNLHIANYDWTIEQAGEDGAFVTMFTVPTEAANMTLTATATGLTSGRVATHQFTDSVSSVTITGVAGSPLTSLPGNITVSFNYQTSSTGTTTADVEILGTSASTTGVSIAPGNGSKTIDVTVPAGTANGTYNVKVTVRNSTGSGANQGNDVKNGAVVINVPTDTTAPTTSISLAGTSGDNGWYKASPVQVTLSATDNQGGSGVQGTFYKLDGGAQTTYTAPFNVSGEGLHTVEYWSKDNAGNEEAHKNQQIKIDTVAPSIGGVRSPDANTHGWNNGDVTVTFNASDATSGVASVTAPITLSGEGANQSASGTATDNAGHSAGTTVSGINIDKTAPTVVVSANRPPDSNGWYTKPVNFSRSVSDGLSGIDPVTDSDVSIASYSGPDTNAGSVSASVSDKAGNSASHTLTFKYDANAPVINASVGDGTFHKSVENLTISATDGSSGSLIALRYELTYSAFNTQSLQQAEPHVTPSVNLGNLTVDGEYTLYIEAEDEAGWKSKKTIHFAINNAAPKIQLNSPDDVPGKYYAEDVSVEFSIFHVIPMTQSAAIVKKTAAGDTGPMPLTSGDVMQDEGQYDVSLHAIDVLGHEASKTLTFYIDKTGPNVNDAVVLMGTPGNSGTYKSPVKLGLSASDPNLRDELGQLAAIPGSGVQKVLYYAVGAQNIGSADEPIEVPGGSACVEINDEGKTTVYFMAVDNVGNESEVKSMLVHYDETPPEITIPGDITAEATSAAGAVVTFVVSASDEVDGAITPTVSHASGSTFPLGTTTVTVTAEDEAGNQSTKSFKVTVRDITPPTIVGGQVDDICVEATAPSGATVSFETPTATDLVAGSVPVTSTHTSGSTFPLGETTVTFSASDGTNVATRSFKVIVKDTTAPSLTLPGNITAVATSAAGAVVNFNVSASDIVDGSITPSVSPASGSIFPLGTTTVLVSAEDSRGNKATGSFTVTVAYQGSFFLQPINANGSSVFKAGSTIPVKFQLSGASAGITNAIAKLYVAKVSNNAIGTEAEAVSTSAADTGNQFRYDATAGQYIFNLSTKGMTEGTYQLRVDLGDGVSHTVLISLKK